MAIRSNKNANLYDHDNDITDDEAKAILAKIDSEMVGMDFSKIPELEVLDPKLYSLLQKHISKEPPEHLKLKILKKIREEKNQSDKPIFFARLKAQVLQPVSFPQFRFVAGLAVLLVIGIISALSYLIYYERQNTRNANQDLIVNQPTPTINATQNPLPTPQVTPILTPNIVGNNPKEDKMDINDTIQNSEKSFTAKDRGQGKSNKSKTGLKNNKGLFNTKMSEEEQVAKNDFPGFLDPTEPVNSPRQPATRSVTREDIESVYLGALPLDPWSMSLKAELEIELGKYRNINKTPEKANVGFKITQEQGIVLLDRVTNEIIWQKKDLVIGKGNPKVIAQEIVFDLVNLTGSKNNSNQ